MIVYRFLVAGGDLSYYTRAFIEYAPVGVLVKVEKVGGKIQGMDLYEVYYDELKGVNHDQSK
jgi:hypothetical protein